MSKILIIIGVLILGFGGYFYLHYAGYYNYLKAHPQDNPSTESHYIVPSQNPARTITYMALGDSLTAGVGVTDFKQTYPYLVAQKLAVADQTVNLVNLGQPSATTDDLIKTQLPAVAKAQPDYITLLIGTNDIHNHAFASTFKTNFHKIIGRLVAQPKAKITVLTIPYLYSTKINFWPYDYELDYETQKFNQIIKDETTNFGLKYVDLYALTSEQFKGDSSLYSVDLFHPSASGYKLWGDLINAN